MTSTFFSLCAVICVFLAAIEESASSSQQLSHETSKKSSINCKDEGGSNFARNEEDEDYPSQLGKFEFEPENPRDGFDFGTYLRIFYKEPWTNVDEEEDGDLLMDVSTRNGIGNKKLRWPNATIPFMIENVKESALNILRDAITIYHTRTCIRFRPWKPDDVDYIVINSAADGCLSYMGKIGGRQEVQLSNKKCFKTLGTSFHELMHVVGFDHEQNRHDRDNYIDIVKSNIKGDRLVNFDKLDGIAFGVPYDYNSVMHYSLFAFAKNRKNPTMIPLNKIPVGTKIGQRNGPTEYDLMKINRMYNCPDRYIK